MKEVKKLSEVEAIKVHDTLGLYYKNVSGDLYSFNKAERIAKNVYDFRFANNDLVYTQTELGDLFIVMDDGRRKLLSGFFYLSFFKTLSQYYAIIKNDSQDDLINKVVVIDQSFEDQKPFKAFRVNVDGYFATVEKNEVVVFDENLRQVWKRGLTEIDRSLVGDEKMSRTFYKVNYQAFIIPIESGQLLALDITNGELIWNQDRTGRTAIFEDKIYCIADYSIKELDANTGEILREESMQGLVSACGFRPTGEHKVYDEFIFSMASGKPGMIAVYDRKTLKFQEILKLDEMIPMETEHLHWHSGKLYVLDFGKTLHVYEKE